MGGVTKRTVEVGTDTCLLGFSGRSYIQSAAFDAATLSPAGGVNEQQVLTVIGSPGGGTFKLSYRGVESSSLNYNETAANIQTALRALSSIGSTGVTVAGSSGGPWTVTFAGPLAAQDVFLLSLSTNALTGGTAPDVTIAQSVMGVTYDPRILLGSAAYPGTLVSASGTKVHEYTAAGGIAEGQTITTTGTPTGGKFVLNFRGDSTSALAFNAAASDVEAALNLIDSIIVAGGVTATGGALPGTPVVVTFNEVGDQESMSVTNTYTGGTTPTTAITTSTAGGDPEEIMGIVDGVEEFIGNLASNSHDVAVYGTFLVLDCRKIKNFALYQEQIESWAAANFNKLRFTS